MKQVRIMALCKVFSFMKANNLSKEDTLNLFRCILQRRCIEKPEGTDHQNIRNFIEFGWDGIAFEGGAEEEIT